MRLLRPFVLIATIGVTAVAHAPAQAQQKQPNIVVIWGDDIGVSNVSAYSLGMMGYKPQTSTALRKRARFSPTFTPNNPARQAAQPLSWVSHHSVPGF